jgi:putative transposase
MPRVARGLADGHIYHIINRGNGRQQVFHGEGDYLSFVELMEQAGERHPVGLLAWCLMPNHFHLLVRPEQASDLSKCG